MEHIQPLYLETGRIKSETLQVLAITVPVVPVFSNQVAGELQALYIFALSQPFNQIIGIM